MKNRMAGERILSLIEKYLTADVLLLLLGLIHSEGGMRGFPFAWLGDGVDNARFAMSALVLAAVVICADILAGMITAAREPKMQRLTKSVQPQAVVSPQKKDQKPLKTEKSSVRGMERERPPKSDAGIEIGHINVPEISEKSVREFVKTLSKGDGDSGEDKGTDAGRGSSSSNTRGLAITIIVIAISMIASVFAVQDFSDDFDSDSIIADDEYEDSYDEACRTYIDYLFTGYIDDADSVLPDSQIIADAIDWDEDNGYYSCDIVNTNYPDDSRQIERYRVETDRGDYIMAFLLDSDAVIYGVAVCEYPEKDLFSDFGTLNLGDGTLTGAEEDQLVSYVEEHAVSIGEAEAEEVSILLY